MRNFLAGLFIGFITGGVLWVAIARAHTLATMEVELTLEAERRVNLMMADACVGWFTEREAPGDEIVLCRIPAFLER